MPIYNDGVAIVGGAGSYTTYVPVYGFTTQQLIEGLYAQLGLTNILDDLNDTIIVSNGLTEKELVINQFIRDAEQTVVVRISRYFDPLEMPNSRWICSRTTWIAAHYISKRRGNEHYFEEMFTEALRELDAMATGELPPHIDIPLREHSYPSMSNLIVDERFGVEKLRVRPTISVGGTYAGQSIGLGWFWGWV